MQEFAPARPTKSTQRSLGMVGAMPRVDAVLQMPMCTTGPGHKKLSACLPGQGRGCSCCGWCVYGLFRKAVVDKRGHLPGQRTTTLDVRDRPEQENAEMDGRTSDLMEDYFMVEEMLWRAERGAICFTFFLRVFTGRFCVCCVLCYFCFFSWAGPRYAFSSGLQQPYNCKILGREPGEGTTLRKLLAPNIDTSATPCQFDQDGWGAG